MDSKPQSDHSTPDHTNFPEITGQNAWNPQGHTPDGPGMTDVAKPNGGQEGTGTPVQQVEAEAPVKPSRRDRWERRFRWPLFRRIAASRRMSHPAYPDAPRVHFTGSALVLEALFALLALASVLMFALRATQSYDRNMVDLMVMFDRIICALFGWRFFWELYRAPNKRKFMRLGWIDLVAAIPEVEFLRSLRLARVVLLIRLLRSTASAAHELARILHFDRAYTVMTATFAVGIASALGSAFLLLGVESGAPGSNVRTAGDALWWSIVTVTSVGYGDFYPVTATGRVVAAWLMIVGLGLVGSTTGLIASWISGEGLHKK